MTDKLKHKNHTTPEPIDIKEDPHAVQFVPAGYVVGTMPDGQSYLVPEFMAPALGQAFEAYQKKIDIQVARADGGTHHIVESSHSCVIGEGHVKWPCDPGLTDRERLGLHAEILALMDRLGICYKDAAHRLYMAELEKLKTEDTCYKAFSNLKARVEKIMEEVRDRAQDAHRP